MEGGALWVSLGCGGEGGTGPTLVLYLRRVGAAATEAWDAAAASAGPTAELGWAAAGVAAAVKGIVVTASAVVGGGATAVESPGLDLPAGGEEELRTRGLKLCPPRVFTMAGLRKEMRGWDENEKGRRGGGGGGGGGGWLFK